jgi:carboxyl-terminal processing protease
MKNNRLSVFIGLIFLVVITVITTLLFSSMGNFILLGNMNGYTSKDIAFIRKIIESKNVLTEKFYENISEDELFDGAMAGMLEAVDDPYTEYLPVKESEMLEQISSGKYEGVGISVSILNNEKYPTILYTLPDSPAEKAELKTNDKILKVNGVSCEGMTLEKVVSLIKLEEGSDVELLIKRGEEEITVPLKTEKISNPSVDSTQFEDIGYIQIMSFDEKTSKEFETAYNKLREENIKGLIVDLRDNGGGVFEEAVKIAKKLVPKGLIVYTEDKNGKKREEFSTGDGIDIPLAVLINENSASASEILAGAIKDRECGTLIGKKTYGKGVVQGWFMIGDGTSIKLTIAKYFTPNGVCIDGIGIEPDIEVELRDSLEDSQLEKALDILRSNGG